MRSTTTTSIVASVVVALLVGGCSKSSEGDGDAWRAPNPPLAEGKEKVRLVFGGDLSLARGLTNRIDKKGKKDPAWVFAKMPPVAKEADLFFANVEMVLADTDAGEAEQKKWRIRAETRMAAGLKAAGLDVVSVANNHAHDFGAEGIASTLKTLAKQGLRVTGARFEGEERQVPLVVNVGPLKVGFLAFNPHGDEYEHRAWYPTADGWNEKRDLDVVSDAAERVDVLVVSMHWGGELRHLPRRSQERVARALVDAGADIIVGHGPHVVEPIEIYKNAIIAYSLGDLVFDKSTPFIRQRTNLRFLLAVDYDGRKRTKWELIPMRMDRNWRPRPWKEADVSSWIRAPDEVQWSARDSLREARVVRVRGSASENCDKWTGRRGRHKRNFGWWLTPRWVCPGDVRGLEIAATIETSGTTREDGLWASPHDGGPLRLSWADVPLGASLELVAGVPDFPLEAIKNAPPVTVRVLVEGLEPFERAVPHEVGWKRFSIDTSKADGQKRDVTLEVVGEGRKEPGFLVDLRVR